MKDEEHSRHSSHRSSWLERLSHLLLREPQDREELVEQLREAEERHLLDADSLDMIEGVFQISEMKVRDIMIPRSQMIVIDEDNPPEIFLPKIVDSSHSRFPVIGENRDEVIGIVLAKDLLKYNFHNGDRTNFSLSQIIRPVTFVPESKRLDVLLKEFRQNRNHMAIVVDEYGGVAGLVTIEDVLEEIVGEIEDEYDIEATEFINKTQANCYSINGLTPIEEFNDYFDSDLNEDEFDTIGGLVTHELGRVPKTGESIEINRYTFKVLNADKRRIRQLEISIEQTSAKSA